MMTSTENKVSAVIPKAALLMVSFGTSYEETRKKTIEAIEKKAAERYADFEVRRAFTSEMIIRKLKKRDQLHIDTPKEAVERLIADGFTRIYVQSLHVINGFEYDDLLSDLAPFESRLEVLKIGKPLLSSHEDYERVTKTLASAYSDLTRNGGKQDQAVVLMGHGTEHHAFSAYPTLAYFLKRGGYSDIKIGCVEGFPGLDEVMIELRDDGYQNVVLAPFMLVAGDHALNDMASDEEDSWKSQLEADGFSVSCILKGLGEMTDIQELYLEHLQHAIED